MPEWDVSAKPRLTGCTELDRWRPRSNGRVGRPAELGPGHVQFENGHVQDGRDVTAVACSACGCRLYLTVEERQPGAQVEVICYACDLGLPCDDVTRTRSPFRHRV